MKTQRFVGISARHKSIAKAWIPASFLLLLALAVYTGFTPAGRGTGSLEQVLSQMEAVGKTFKSFKARFSQKKYTAILEEFDAPESGEFLYSRAEDGSALLRQERTNPALRILTIKGGVATIYQPALKQAQVYNLGKNKDKAEYLAIGLGQSPGKLRQTFNMEYRGAENVGGTPCSVLVLRPKSSSASAFFSSITLWTHKQTGIPVQQRLQEPNGDYLLVTLTDVRLNSSIPASKFDQKLPGDVEVMRFQ